MTSYATRHPLPSVPAESVIEVLVTRRITTVDGAPIATTGHESPVAAYIAALAAVHGHPLRARLVRQTAGIGAHVIVDSAGEWQLDVGSTV